MFGLRESAITKMRMCVCEVKEFQFKIYCLTFSSSSAFISGPFLHSMSLIVLFFCFKTE